MISKNSLNDELVLCLVMFRHDLHGQYLPQGKGKLVLKKHPVSKEEVVYVCVHSHGIARNKYYSVITKRMNFNCPVVETSANIEPNNNDLELNCDRLPIF